jgi:hypothetical protein
MLLVTGWMQVGEDCMGVSVISFHNPFLQILRVDNQSQCLESRDGGKKVNGTVAGFVSLLALYPFL